MTVRLNLCDAIGDIGPEDRAWIMRTLEAVRDKAADRLELREADVNVVVAPGFTIPEYGMGGFTFNRSVAQIVLDPWSPRFKDPGREARLGALLAHEMCHLARFRHPAAKWAPKHMSRASLGHVLISEGLAQAFEEEMGFELPFYATAVVREPLWDLGGRAMADFEKTNFDYDAWFFGRAGDPAFPRHGGYSLGYAIVRAWMMMMETTPSEEIGLEPAEVLKAWRTGRLDI
ncbi:MAG: hypothetical protein JSS20_02140 [Proteobacteria bacterium]|nr:hypothetical protein [Pseudomonadota bacterium]